MRRRAVHAGWAICLAGPLVTTSVSASANECKHPPQGWLAFDRDESTGRCLPKDVKPQSRFVFGGAIGSCNQYDPLLGGSGLCGEVTAGGVIALPWRLRVLLEAAAGSSTQQSSGYPAYGLGESTGGYYVAPRVLFGHDWTTLFFTAIGGQLRVTDPYHRLFNDNGGVLQYLSLQALFEAGTRFQSETTGVELALRVGVGQARVFSEAPGLDQMLGTSQTPAMSWSHGTLGLDALVVARWLVPKEVSP